MNRYDATGYDELPLVEGWATPPVSAGRQHFFRANGRSSCGHFTYLGALTETHKEAPSPAPCGMCLAAQAFR